ncbi:probable salivary secreted peptide [Choristoneura fumiferana]|uniref:probable salivary secreted peptide n=1 Tax=Choristoneura fumiferana TaxID=7141 RepID=UPI003D15E10A
MKSVYCLLILSAVMAVQPALVNPSTRANLNIGVIYPGDRLLSRSYLYRPAVVNTVQSEDFIYRGNLTTRISAIQAVEYGYTQFANIWIINGGINQANVTLRVQSQVSRGYYYLIDIWGR